MPRFILLLSLLLLSVSVTVSVTGLECIDCMKGMAMPHCPDPDACEAEAANFNTTGSVAATACSMSMFLNLNDNVCVLADSWRVTTSTQWVMTTLAILLLCFAREALALYRQDRMRLCRMKATLTNKSTHKPSTDSPSHQHTHSTLQVPAKDDGHTPLLLNDIAPQQRHAINHPLVTGSIWAFTEETKAQLLDSVYYMLSVTLAYILMLIVMTYHIVIFLLVILACGLANFITAYCYSALLKHRLRQRLLARDGSLGNLRVDLSQHRTSLAIQDGDHCCQTGTQSTNEPLDIQA